MTRPSLVASPASIEPARGEYWPQIENLLLTRELPLQGAKEHLGNFLVAADSGRVVGVAGLEVYGAYGLLRSVAVQEHLAGRGLGARLVEAAVARAQSLGVHELYLLTTTAAGYFERLGFERISSKEIPFALSASEELQGACPATATVMRIAPHLTRTA
jgi:amino-acid N-acetyltransferase